jgi:ERCC4-related helicase
MSNEFKVQIPTEIVRSSTINATAFVSLAKLIQGYYISGCNEVYRLDHKVLMNFLNIKDNKTLKEALKTLHEQGHVLNQITNLPRKGGIDIEINPQIIPELNNGSIFTQLTKNVLDKSVISAVGYIGVRLLYYYKSYINEKDTKKQYAHPAEELIAKDLGISKTTVIEYNKKLKKHKLLKIESHELSNSNEYKRVGDRQMIIFTKYNNHYTILHDKIDGFPEKNGSKLVI